MPAVQLSRSARADLLRIGAYTLERWGPAQTARYISNLEKCANMLGANPLLGRACLWIRPGLRRFEKGRHVSFYRPIEGGIFISRIMHRSVLPENDAF
jgi:toxin ParE1/3/4